MSQTTSTSKNRIIYDWITFTSKIDSYQSIIDLLGLGNCTFTDPGHGINGYPYCLQFGGISICYGVRDDMGVCCIMSGKGCRSYETFGNGDYKALFDHIISNYSDDADKRQCNLTRLDVAYDDFDGLLDMQTVFDAATAGGYTKSTIYVDNKPCTYYSLCQGDFVSRFKNYDVTISSQGMTCGFGSYKSDVYVRIYDKLSEQRVPGVDHWVRCEIQLRRGNAIGFAMLTGDLCTNYFGVLNNYLRFVEPSDTDSNKRRAATADWWSKFTEYRTDKLHIYQSPGMDYDITCLDGYVYKQCAGAVHTMIQLLGVDEFMRRLDEAVIIHPLNSRYKSILDQWLPIYQARASAAL